MNAFAQYCHDLEVNKRITSVPTHAEAFALVKSGAVDAFFMDDIILHLVRASGNDNSTTTVLEDDYSRDAFALMFQKDDLEFKEFVDQVLADRFKSGVMQRLYGQWFQQPIPALRSMNVNMSMNVQTKAVFDSPNDRP